METVNKKSVLISGASIAGLSTAYWMNQSGYKVTIIEIANRPRSGGTPVDVKDAAVAAAKRMGIFEQIKANRLTLEKVDYKNADDVTEGSFTLSGHVPEDDIEIERDKFMAILLSAVQNEVEFIFNDSITALNETADGIQATFKNGGQRSFDLVFGCDGIHSGVRKIWFGHETEYSHFLEQYFSITIVNKLLIPQNSMQLYNVPGKAIMLNAYNNKTDIVFCFVSEKEIPYHYRDEAQQRKIIQEQFSGESWRTPELLKAAQESTNFYFDKLCQIRMPS